MSFTFIKVIKKSRNTFLQTNKNCSKKNNDRISVASLCIQYACLIRSGKWPFRLYPSVESIPEKRRKHHPPLGPEWSVPESVLDESSSSCSG